MEESERYARAKRKVGLLRGFYIHATAYVLVNIFLIIVNLLTTPSLIWFHWSILGWGVGLAAHGASIFFGSRFLGDDWEKRKIREILDDSESA